MKAKNCYQTIVSVFFLLVMLLHPIFVFAESNTAESKVKVDQRLHLRVQLFDISDAYTYVHEFHDDGQMKYVLFFPADCNRERLHVFFDEAWLKVNGTELSSGMITSAFSKDGKVSIETPLGLFPLIVMSSSNLPSLYMTTESGALDAIHADKDHREKGHLSIAVDGKIVLEKAALSRINGRGNSSWVYNEKKGYNIKFDKKIGLLGMKEAKKWALIPNNMDDTLLRNALAYTAAKKTRLPYTINFEYVDLYINGEYRGNYFVCEKVDIGKNRIAIKDLEKANEKANPLWNDSLAAKNYGSDNGTKYSWSGPTKDPNDITGGYLLEYDFPEVFESEPSAFITKNGTYLTVRSPKYATENEVRYISTLYENFESALLAKNGKNKYGKYYTDYIDIDSFVDALLLRECTGNVDIGHSSWFVFLPENSERFYMAPIWDFDLSMENASLLPDCIRFLAEKQYDQKLLFSSAKEKTFIELLCSHRDFLDMMAQRYTSLKDSLFESMKQTARAFSESIHDSASMNAMRWGFPNGMQDEETLISYLTARESKIESDFSNLDYCIDAAVEDLESGYESGLTIRNTIIIVFCFMVVLLLCIIIAKVLMQKNNRSKKAQTRRRESKKRK
ncbi:MAG: CotH kinase family protein [Clostridia bacterium]|nr:CotH kinase family protein [Clostridia bacterium]